MQGWTPCIGSTVFGTHILIKTLPFREKLGRNLALQLNLKVCRNHGIIFVICSLMLRPTHSGVLEPLFLKSHCGDIRQRLTTTRACDIRKLAELGSCKVDLAGRGHAYLRHTQFQQLGQLLEHAVPHQKSNHAFPSQESIKFILCGALKKCTG